MGYNAELQPYVPVDYFSAGLQEEYERYAQMHFWAFGGLPRIPM